MADSLSVDLDFTLRAVWKDTQDLGTIMDSPVLNLDDTLADGVGLDLADILWHDERTLAATSETLDLSALTRTVFGDSATVAFVKVKGFIIKNKATTAGFNLTVGNAASNGWTGWTNPATATVAIGPNAWRGFWEPSLAGVAVSGTNKNVKIDAGATSVTYRIFVIGTSS
jgi:hypothetical protein